MPRRRIGLGINHRDVGNVGVGDPHLGAVEDEVVAVASSPRPHRAEEVRATIGFRHRVAAEQLASDQPGDVPLDQLVAAPRGDRQRDGCGLQVHGGAQWRVDPGQLLGDRSQRGVASCRTAHGLGEAAPEEAEPAHIAVQLAGELLLLLELAHSRANLAQSPVADQLRQLVCEIVRHPC